MRCYISFLLLFVGVIVGTAQVSLIHCGKLIDVEAGKVLEKMTIVVNGNIIEKVVSGYQTPTAGEQVIDLKTMTVMPGWMDMHVHIEHESGPRRYEETFRENESYVALKATQYCRRTLNAGFTTVRDLGGSGVNVSLREAIKNGFIDGPRIYTCEKSIATTGGHGDPSNGVRDNLKGDPGPKEGVINSPEEAAKAVRQRYKNGADCIKITSTGGVLSVASDGSGPQFTTDEVAAVVKAANDYGFVTAAHAHGAEGMKRAVLGGIHSIEHGTFMDEEIMNLMKEKGTYYVPTIAAGKFVAEKAKIPGFYPAIIVPKALKVGPQIQKTFEAAYKAGVKIAFGTDSGVSIHGENAKEFIFMTEAGMPAMEAIRAATKNAASLLRIYDKVGSLTAGKWADIIATREDPTQNIQTVLEVPFVMKDGKVFKQ
ncbi:MAG TPA: amidohydrolase family protein [Saprospiraceae bacterium]|nr:amidohydrolase family protein [Saprospiraceae bacterium]HRG66114.1 amidohydrolase family protein [Saprospiraceae bacterium]